jgi:hypothetical protein
MPGDDCLSTKARRAPWNKGQTDRRQAPVQTKPSLVNPNPARDRKTDPRPCPPRTGDIGTSNDARCFGH